jgi:hypothetical protein
MLREVRLALTTADQNLLRAMHIAPPIVPPEEIAAHAPTWEAIVRGELLAEMEKSCAVPQEELRASWSPWGWLLLAWAAFVAGYLLRRG